MTSLSFTNTVSTSTKFTTHQPQVRNRNIPTDYSLVWFWGIWLWSGQPWPTLTTQTPWSTGAHPFCRRERKGCGETEWQVATTRTTTVELVDGSLGEKSKADAGPDVAWFPLLVTQTHRAPACSSIFYNQRSSWRGSPPPAGYRSGSFSATN